MTNPKVEKNPICRDCRKPYSSLLDDVDGNLSTLWNTWDEEEQYQHMYLCQECLIKSLAGGDPAKAEFFERLIRLMTRLQDLST